MSDSPLSPSELAQIAQSPVWRQRRIEVRDTSAGKVIVKGQRAPRHPARYQLLNGIARVLGVPFLKAAPMHGGAHAQAVEAARLRVLHAAGAPVPELLHVAPDHIVMRWLGDAHLGDLLQARHPQAEALWQAGAQALLQAHAAGQYLSQGFARNMIVDTHTEPPRLAGVIDFEDDPLEVMSLPEAQVRDWLTYLHSTLWTLPLPLAEVDARLDASLAAESALVRHQFLHACRQLGWLRHLPRGRRWGRDTLALRAVAAAAHRYAQRHGAAPEAEAPPAAPKISD